MSANWIKWCKGLAEKREVRVLASRFKLDRHEIAGRLMVLWEWCDENMDDTDFDGEDAVMSLGDRDGLVELVDGSTGIPGMLDALESKEVAWMHTAEDGRVVFKKLRRHNGKTAKERASEQRKKANQRGKAKGKRTKKTEESGTDEAAEPVPVAAGPDERRREETRGPFDSSMGDRKTIGSADAKRGDTQSAARNQSSPSPKKIDGDECQEEPFDLSFVDWDRVVSIAESAAKRVPPKSVEDRRAWLKYGVLADVRLGEEWMIDAAEAVLRATKTNRTKQAHFVAVLKGKAEEQHGIGGEEFVGMCRRIEIPSNIWKSPVLEVRK